MSAIKHWLRAVRRRLLLVRAVEAGLQAALWASLAALAVLALGWTGAGWAKRAFPSAHLVLVLLPAGWFIGFSARLLAGIHLRCAASFADGAADLKERVATAIEREADEPRVSGVSALQIKDAEAHIEGLLPRQLHYRRTMARRARFVAAGALLLTALAFIPRPTLETGAGRPGPQEAAEKINAAARKLKTSDNVPAGARESIRRAAALAQRVKAGDVGSPDAAREAKQLAEALKALIAEAEAADKVEVTLQSLPDIRSFLAASSQSPTASAEAAAALAERFSKPPPEGLSADERAAILKQIDKALADTEAHEPLKDALEGIRRALGDAKPEHILTDELQESLKALAEALARSKIPAAGREAIAGATGALLQAADLLEAAAEQATGAAVVSINQVLPDPPLNGTAPHAQTPVEAAAWKFAIQQAERMIEKGEVRPEHREIVRKYFSR